MKIPILAAASSIAAFSLSHAASIGVKFLDSDDTAWGTASAGASGYAQENWNFVSTDWSGSGDNDAALANILDSDGNAVTYLQDISYNGTSDPVHYDSANTWRSGAGNGDANATLMNGYLDDGLDDQPYINISLSSAASGTSIVIYFNGDGQNAATGRYWLEEWTDPLLAGTVITDQVGISSNGYSGTFESAGSYSQTGSPANVDVASGNYIVFENITAQNIRIRGAGNGDPAGEDFGRAPINGFQVITTVPEPTSSLLIALSGAALLIRRRK